MGHKDETPDAAPDRDALALNETELEQPSGQHSPAPLESTRKRLVATLRTFAQSVLRVLRFAASRAGEERVPQVAASLAFTTILSMVPILAVAFALFTAFPLFG